MTTTLATISDRLQGIPTAALSPTLQGAIALTRYMDVQYIWLDSMCILQDSSPDWEEESSKMGSYYGDGLFTITAARDRAKGLFQERTFPNGPYCKLTVSTNRSQQSTHPSAFYFLPKPHKPIRELDSKSHLAAKIFSRGWTLQEELLSPRVISFEETQTYFRTHGKEIYECGTSAPANIMHEQSHERWLSIVQGLSKRQLTNEDDKLPALSGLAAEFQKHWNYQYLAGIWQRQLWRQLQWYVVPSRTCIPRRPSKYRAPSWSWASTDGHICFEPIEDQSKLFVEVLWSLARASSLDLRGRVSEGRIGVQGYVDHADFDAVERIDFRLTDDGSKTGIVHPDAFLSKAKGTTDAYVLRLSEKLAILLHPVEGLGAVLNDAFSHYDTYQGTYERLASVHTQGSGPINKSSKRTIWIV